MRHKYVTSAIVLARAPLGEANRSVVVLTKDLGLLAARAQGVRRSGARLAPALETFVESEVTLVRGKEGWRITGARLEQSWFMSLSGSARVRAGRLASLVARLAAHDAADRSLYPIVRDALAAFVREEESLHDAIECLAAFSILTSLGFGESGAFEVSFEAEALRAAERDRAHLVERINHGIEASGL